MAFTTSDCTCSRLRRRCAPPPLRNKKLLLMYELNTHSNKHPPQSPLSLHRTTTTKEKEKYV